MRAQLDQAMTELRPGERLPYSWAGFVPQARAAVLAYAAAYRAGLDAEIRPALFETLCVHGFDLDDVEVVHGLIRDVRCGRGAADVEPVSHELPVSDLIGQPERAVFQLRQRWRDELSVLGGDVLPVLVVDGKARLHGGHAVSWLGDEMARRGVDPNGAATPCAATTSEHRATSRKRTVVGVSVRIW